MSIARSWYRAIRTGSLALVCASLLGTITVEAAAADAQALGKRHPATYPKRMPDKVREALKARKKKEQEQQQKQQEKRPAVGMDSKGATLAAVTTEAEAAHSDDSIGSRHFPATYPKRMPDKVREALKARKKNDQPQQPQEKPRAIGMDNKDTLAATPRVPAATAGRNSTTEPARDSVSLSRPGSTAVFSPAAGNVTAIAQDIAPVTTAILTLPPHSPVPAPTPAVETSGQDRSLTTGTQASPAVIDNQTPSPEAADEQEEGQQDEQEDEQSGGRVDDRALAVVNPSPQPQQELEDTRRQAADESLTARVTPPADRETLGDAEEASVEIEGEEPDSNDSAQQLPADTTTATAPDQDRGAADSDEQVPTDIAATAPDQDGGVAGSDEPETADTTATPAPDQDSAIAGTAEQEAVVDQPLLPAPVPETGELPEELIHTVHDPAFVELVKKRYAYGLHNTAQGRRGADYMSLLTGALRHAWTQLPWAGDLQEPEHPLQPRLVDNRYQPRPVVQSGISHQGHLAQPAMDLLFHVVEQAGSSGEHLCGKSREFDGIFRLVVPVSADGQPVSGFARVAPYNESAAGQRALRRCLTAERNSTPLTLKKATDRLWWSVDSSQINSVWLSEALLLMVAEGEALRPATGQALRLAGPVHTPA